MHEPDPSPPDRPVPALACDCHMHVFGLLERYPGAPGRTYTPSAKPLEEYRAIADRLGLERTVLVQPSAYGTDNRAMLDRLGSGQANLRGVAVIDPSFSHATLELMHAAGVRAIRLNLMSPRITDTSAARALLEQAVAQVAPFGWHVQIYGDGDILSVVAPVLPDLPVPVVFDHMGGARVRSGSDEPGFRTLCRLLAEAKCWAKVSGADIVVDFAPDLMGAVPFARAIVAANPAQVVWGTDWPHLEHPQGGIDEAAPPAVYRPVDEGKLLDVLRAAVDDEATWRAILVDNPARLYGF